MVTEFLGLKVYFRMGDHQHQIYSVQIGSTKTDRNGCGRIRTLLASRPESSMEVVFCMYTTSFSLEISKSTHKQPPSSC